MGTPAYMAPEQRVGDPIDAKADQFSFCLTAWEVLFGERPWETTIPLETGDVRAAPERSPTARYLHRCLARGLSSEPRERYAAMPDLIAALRRDPARARRRWFALGLAGGLAGTLGVAYAVEREQRCDDVTSPLRDDAAPAIASAFEATEVPGAAETFERSWAGLRGYAERWHELARSACREAKIDGSLPAEHYALTQRCLEDRSLRLDALLAVLGEADADVVGRALQAVAALPDLQSCRDPSRVRGEAPLPDDPELREQVREARAAIALVETKWSAGRLDEARAQIETVFDLEATENYGPLRAEVESIRGDLAREQNDLEVSDVSLQAAYWAGLEFRHDLAAARAARQLALSHAHRNKLQEAERWLKSAETLTRRASSGDADRANLLATKALVAGRAGRLAETEELLLEARAIVEHRPLDHARHGRNLVTAYAMQARFAEALATALDVKDQLSAELGPDHFELASVYHNLGELYSDLGRPEEARTAAYRALEIRQRVLGPRHPAVASSHHSLGRIDYRFAEPRGAKKKFAKAREIAIATRPPGDPLIGRTTSSLAAAMVDLGEYDAALQLQRELLATRTEVLGEDHPKTAQSHRAVGLTLFETGRYEEALPPLRRAEATFIKTNGPLHGQTLDHRNLLARTLAAAGRPKQALQVFDDTIPNARRSRDALPELVMLLSDRATVRLAAGDEPGALADSAEAVAIAEGLGDETPDRIMAIHKRMSVLVAAGQHQEAADLAALAQGGPLGGARPQDRANFLIAHARALEPIDRAQALTQATAAAESYRTRAATPPPELESLLARLR